MGSYNYYDVHSILAEQETLTTSFRTGAYQLGFLDPGGADSHLARDKKVELPLWLCMPLSQRSMINVEPPKFLSQKFRSALSADATVINLHDRSSYFYQVCADTAQMTGDQTILPMLRTCFTERYKRIMDKSLNSMSSDTSEFTRILTHSERALFQSGSSASSDFQSWRRRKAEKLVASRSVETERMKRPRLN